MHLPFHQYACHICCCHSPVTPHQRKTSILCVPIEHVVVLTRPTRCPQQVGLSFVKQALTRHIVEHLTTNGVRPFVPNKRVVVDVPRPPHTPRTRHLWRWLVEHIAERVRPACHRARRRARLSSTSSSVFFSVPLMRPSIRTTRLRTHSLFFKPKASNDKPKGTAVIYRSMRVMLPLQLMSKMKRSCKTSSSKIVKTDTTGWHLYKN